MGKVISRNAGGLDDYDILEVFRNVQLTADGIHHLGSANIIAGSIRYAGGFQSDDEVIATLQPFSDFLLEHLIGLPISVAGPFAVDSRSDFQLFLFLPNLGNLLFGKEAWICFSLRNQFLCVAAIDFPSVALGIIAVIPQITMRGNPFIELNSEERQGGNDGFHGILYISLVVRIFDTKVENAFALMGQSFIHKGTVQISQVDKTGRTRSQTGNFRSFRQISLRIHCFIIFRRPGDVRINTIA